MVDFNSNLKYNNFKCGDLNIYPPCKSFYDLGKRISTLNNESNVDIYILNKDYENEISISGNQVILGEINNSFEVLNFQIVDKYLNINKNSILNIDGINVNSYFLINNIKNTSSNKTKLYFKNFNFNNWYFNLIKSDNNNQIEINFNNCTFNNIKTIINDEESLNLIKLSNNEYREINFNHCSFKNINSFDFNQLKRIDNLFLFNVKSTNLTFNGCYFSNIELYYSTFIFLNSNSKLNIQQCLINNIFMRWSFIQIIGNNTSIDINSTKIYLNSIGRLIYLNQDSTFNSITVNNLYFFRNDLELYYEESIDNLPILNKYIFELFSKAQNNHSLMILNNTYIKNNYNSYSSGILNINFGNKVIINNLTLGEECKKGLNISNIDQVTILNSFIETMVYGEQTNLIIYDNNYFYISLKYKNSTLKNINSKDYKNEIIKNEKRKSNNIILLSTIIPSIFIVIIFVILILLKEFKIIKFNNLKKDIEMEQKAKVDND